MRELVYIHTILTLLATCVSGRQACLPSCSPPSDVTGCAAFITPDKCFTSDRGTVMTIAECGCAWQKYMQDLVGRERNIVFTTKGIQCFVWAMTVCEVEKEASSMTTTPASKDIEIDVETGDVFGKIDQDGGNYTAAESVVDKILSEKDLKRLEEKGYVIKKKRNWFYLGSVQYDKFKLGVFCIVLFFNVVCVAVAVCCRLEKKTKEKEIRLSGDLDPDNVVPKKKPPSRPARIINLENFLEKLRLHKKRKREKEQNRHGLLEMDHVRSSKKSQSPYMCRPAYNDSIDEHSDLLDTTYEEPVPTITGEIHPRQIRRDSLSDEDTLYENTRQKDGRSVSFKITPGPSTERSERVPSRKTKPDFELWFPSLKWPRK